MSSSVVFLEAPQVRVICPNVLFFHVVADGSNNVHQTWYFLHGATVDRDADSIEAAL